MCKFNAKRREKFLETLRAGYNVTQACNAIQISRDTAYKYRNREPELAEQWDAAVAVGEDVLVDLLEQEADRRGKEGVDKPVYQQGKLVGYIREYSDTLLIFRLKGLRPNKYRDRVAQEVSGPGGGPIEVKSIADAIIAAAEAETNDGQRQDSGAETT